MSKPTCSNVAMMAVVDSSTCELHQDVVAILSERWALSGPHGADRLNAVLRALATPPGEMTCRYDPFAFPGGVADAEEALAAEVAHAEEALSPPPPSRAGGDGDGGDGGGGEVSVDVATAPDEHVAGTDGMTPSHVTMQSSSQAAPAPAPATKAAAVLATMTSAARDKRRVWVVTPHALLPDVLTVKIPAAPHMELIPEPKEVVVGHLCAMAVLRGANVFAPGVMAVSSGVREGDRVSLWADVDGLCVRGTIAEVFEGRKVCDTHESSPHSTSTCPTALSTTLTSPDTCSHTALPALLTLPASFQASRCHCQKSRFVLWRFTLDSSALSAPKQTKPNKQTNKQTTPRHFARSLLATR
jgi:predicted ribosome-associated RNA-binding protein Tma20